VVLSVATPVQDEYRGEALRWTETNLESLSPSVSNLAPVVSASDAKMIVEGFDVWDAWPLADPGGRPISWLGGELWFALTVPREDDPEQRGHVRQGGVDGLRS